MNKPILTAIVAMDENRGIGKADQLLWHLPRDLKRFKMITLNHVVIMGRKTYVSIGKALPNRTNIIITRNPAFHAPNCIIANSLADAICSIEDQEEIFIIGGAEIYRQSLAMLERLYLTIVHATFTADVFFPAFNWEDWQIISREYFAADTQNQFAHSFYRLERQRS